MSTIERIIAEVKKAVQGKDQVLIWILMTILAGGNILLEDIPGVGKTTIALAFSRALGLDYGRVQFNPDVLPSDITGYSVYNKQTGQMEYKDGAILCNLFLADELNRATSRTQSYTGKIVVTTERLSSVCFVFGPPQPASTLISSSAQRAAAIHFLII